MEMHEAHQLELYKLWLWTMKYHNELTLLSKSSKSLSYIETVYPVIGEPPLSGVDQDIITLSGFHVVVGALGFAGTYAVRILTVFENSLNPYAFLASTLNWYVRP